EVQADLKIVEGMNVGEYGSSKGLSNSTKLSASETKAKMMANSAKWLGADATTRDDLARDNQNLGNSMGWTYDPVEGRWYYDKQKKLPVYHEGGVVGGTSYATKSTEELAKLLKGELVITPPQADKVMDMITNNNNNSESFAPEINIIIEGNADESIVDLLKKESKNIANMVAEEFSKSRANRGYKTKLKPI
ncbi:MAG TPA: hypothetical protein DD434_09700, partial [Bacteroidales bacterium]|nr:hypothetical protein [Bacteroidales bacterium]